MDMKRALKNFQEGWKDSSVRKEYGWTIAGTVITGTLYAIGQPEIGKYSALATTVHGTANAIKQYRTGMKMLSV